MYRKCKTCALTILMDHFYIIQKLIRNLHFFRAVFRQNCIFLCKLANLLKIRLIWNDFMNFSSTNWKKLLPILCDTNNSLQAQLILEM